MLIAGASGSGKSALALQLMAFGAALVSDDRTCIVRRDGHYVASAPAAIAGLIEARGVGVLGATPMAETRLVLAIDMDRTETERLPPRRVFNADGLSLPCLYKIDAPYFPAVILQYLKNGRRDTE